MVFSLIVCTFQRPSALNRLLEALENQTCYPDDIIIVDGSTDRRTQQKIQDSSFRNLRYFRVKKSTRGLTRQRNFGVSKVSSRSEVVFFLDDDTVPAAVYFEEVLKVYEKFPDAIGVSGYIINEVHWKAPSDEYNKVKGDFEFEGWIRREGSRFGLRRKFGLEPDAPPGWMPKFSHGYSISFLPPSGKIYEVELLMGGIASYRKMLFNVEKFSGYFNGYGLYEDAEFSLRASRHGSLFVNTAAEIEHYHAAEGRPKMWKYGKMVMRNGWYVWRIKNPHPSLKDIVKWHSISLLLTIIRLANSVSSQEKQKALPEAAGRFYGWLSLFLKRPTAGKLKS